MILAANVWVGFAASATIALSSACGGDGGAPEMSATLTDKGCAYEGAEKSGAGSVRVEVENQSSVDGAFALAGIADGSTVEDLERYMDEERRRHRQGAELRGPPAFYSQVVRVSVAAGTSSQLPADLATGRYALMCFNDDPPVWRVYLATQFDLSP